MDKKALEAAVAEMKDTAKWLGIFLGFAVGVGVVGTLLVTLGVFLLNLFGVGWGIAVMVGTIVLGGILISGIAKYVEVKRRG